MKEKDYFAKNEFMEEAILEARLGIYEGDGGPFGSVIVKNGKIIGRGHNTVVKDNDSTAHGEIKAIRDAEKNISGFDLSGAVLYTTGEPCAMCLAACMWANIDKVYYGCNLKDNSIIGFRDEKIDNLLGGREKVRDHLIEVDRDACLKLFSEFKNLEHIQY